MVNISAALTGNRCLTPACRASPYRLSTIECLLSHPQSLFGQTKRIVAHEACHTAFQAENG